VAQSRTPSGQVRAQYTLPLLLFEEAVKLQRIVRGALDSELRPLQLRVQEYRALAELKQNAAISGVELARRLQGSPQAVQPMLGRLEKAGYIERDSYFSRSSYETKLTPRGEEVLAVADSVLRAFDVRLNDRLGQSTMAALLNLLQAAHSAVELLGEAEPMEEEEGAEAYPDGT
jgi:DNA-binding MarR family transcriptional regulator